MKQQKDQHKVGIRQKPANKMAADKSAQNTGGDAVTPRTSSPSTPAMNAATRKGEGGGEIVFKKRLKKKRATKI